MAWLDKPVDHEDEALTRHMSDHRFCELLETAANIRTDFIKSHPDDFAAAGGVGFEPHPQLLVSIVEGLPLGPVGLFRELNEEMLDAARERKESGKPKREVLGGSGLYMPLLIRWAHAAVGIYRGERPAQHFLQGFAREMRR